MSDTQVFKEICNEYGFEEVPQTAEGIYCDECCQIHKSPTKMYTDHNYPSKDRPWKLCRFQVVRIFGVDPK